jgi:hypothetical protein
MKFFSFEYNFSNLVTKTYYSNAREETWLDTMTLTSYVCDANEVMGLVTIYIRVLSSWAM